jgi:NDP-sugar pyrophosphorylase family protein
VNIDAIVLAGGMGTRLRGAVPDRPKVLATVRGRPFLTHLLDQLSAAKIENAVISTGYMADMVEAQIGTTYSGLAVSYSREMEPLGTGGAVRLALDKTASDPVLVLNGDSFCEFQLDDLLQFHQDIKARATILLTRVDNIARFGRVETDAQDKVVRFEEKDGSQVPGWINAGVYLLNRDVLNGLPTDQSISMEKEIFPMLISHGLHAFRGGGKFLDIGTPESYAEAERFFS